MSSSVPPDVFHQFLPVATYICMYLSWSCVENNKSYQLSNHEDWLNNYCNDGPEQKAIKCCCPAEFITMIDDSLIATLSHEMS